jgi:hypothetical protein
VLVFLLEEWCLARRLLRVLLCEGGGGSDSGDGDAYGDGSAASPLRLEMLMPEVCHAVGQTLFE